MEELELLHKGTTIRLRNERCYTLGSADNVHRYEREYQLDTVFSSYHGIECRQSSGETHSCLVASNGGSTAIHDRSAIIQQDSIVLAVGDRLCRLSIPSLEMLWFQQVDEATCFEVYWSQRYECLVVHGELLVSRVTLDGQIVWQAGCKDIFTGKFELFDDYIVAEDFNHELYHIDMVSGKTDLIE